MWYEIDRRHCVHCGLFSRLWHRDDCSVEGLLLIKAIGRHYLSVQYMMDDAVATFGVTPFSFAEEFA